jgi:hypothetical protein
MKIALSLVRLSRDAANNVCTPDEDAVADVQMAYPSSPAAVAAWRVHRNY